MLRPARSGRPLRSDRPFENGGLTAGTLVAQSFDFLLDMFQQGVQPRWKVARVAHRNQGQWVHLQSCSQGVYFSEGGTFEPPFQRADVCARGHLAQRLLGHAASDPHRAKGFCELKRRRCAGRRLHTSIGVDRLL